MATRLPSRVETAPLQTALLALCLGLVLHGIDQTISIRAGPIPILLTAPVVATLAYLRVSTVERRRLAALLGWGTVSSGVGVVLVYLLVVGNVLPRALTPLERIAYDLGMFLWFVLALTAVYALAARRNGPRQYGLLLVAPAVQALYGFLLPLLVTLGLYG